MTAWVHYNHLVFIRSGSGTPWQATGPLCPSRITRKNSPTRTMRTGHFMLTWNMADHKAHDPEFVI